MKVGNFQPIILGILTLIFTLRRRLPPIGQCQQHGLLLFSQSHFCLASVTNCDKNRN